ncbi:RES domain-containing protein [Croceicoccus esteveae]|uniref:RES domain-containing protein n=1 Tax=Croceicoccus esteveae TaxID=3075597 RepID=UPI003D77CC72
MRWLICCAGPTPASLNEPWRAGDFPIRNDRGARRSEGQWHRAGTGIIHASCHCSTAMLEKLVHHSGVLHQSRRRCRTQSWPVVI